jgi:hypothetical protein
MAEHEHSFAPTRDLDRLVEAPPTTCEQLPEERPINVEYHSGRAHRPTGTNCDGFRGGGIMSFGEHGHVTADIRKRRLRQHPAWRGCVDAVRVKHFAGQV